MTHLVLMTFLNSSNAGLLDVDTTMETVLLHMTIVLDDSMLCLDDILHDELVDDANLAVPLLVDYPDAIHDVVLDPNIHDDVTHDATFLLNILLDGPTLLMRWSQDTLDEVVQKCCIQFDVEVHDDDHSMSTQSLLDSHS